MYRNHIRQIYNVLSPSYRRIADYLLNNYQDAAFMTAAQVGRASQVDTTSVVRFAQRLGYPGFPELIADIQEQVKRDLRAIYEPAPQERTVEAVFRRSLMHDRDSLDYMLLHTEDEDVRTVVQILKTAPRIFVVGEAAAIHLAEILVMRLASFGFNVITLPGDALGRTALTIPLQAGDALFGLGLTNAATGVAVAIKVAREEGAHTIALVASPATATANAAEHVLYAPTRTGGALYSLTAAAAMLQALLQALTIEMEDRTADWALGSKPGLAFWMVLGIVASLPRTDGSGEVDQVSLKTPSASMAVR